jgi:hypothetical protein
MNTDSRPVKPQETLAPSAEDPLKPTTSPEWFPCRTTLSRGLPMSLREIRDLRTSFFGSGELRVLEVAPPPPTARAGSAAPKLVSGPNPGDGQRLRCLSRGRQEILWKDVDSALAVAQAKP